MKKILYGLLALFVCAADVYGSVVVINGTKHKAKINITYSGGCKGAKDKEIEPGGEYEDPGTYFTACDLKEIKGHLIPNFTKEELEIAIASSLSNPENTPTNISNYNNIDITTIQPNVALWMKNKRYMIMEDENKEHYTDSNGNKRTRLRFYFKPL